MARIPQRSGTSSWDSPPWWGWVAVVVGAVVAFTSFGMAVSSDPPPRHDATAEAAPLPLVAGTTERPVVAFLGDSYSAGSGHSQHIGYVQPELDP
jgi:hypothetical protein